MKKRVNEILNSMNSFTKDRYNKQELLQELLSLQRELVNLTFNDVHAENSKLRMWDVESHLNKLNEECDCVADELLEKVKLGCKIVGKTIKSEILGLKGEQSAFRSLETLRCKKTIIKNVEFILEGHRTELDAIVVTEKAIFIVEVKNTAKDIYIDERGNYWLANDTMFFDKNIGERMNEKDYLLSDALKDSGVENINIQSVVVFTNSAMHIDNHFPYIDTCYLSDMPHIINGYKGEHIYNDNDIRKIVDNIEKNRRHENYPMPIDMQEFKKDFAVLMATLEKASQKNRIIEDDEQSQDMCKVQNKKKHRESVVEWIKTHKKESYIVASLTAVAATVVACITKNKKH